ncbi:MAG: helix-turn-helix domain-containing protein [Planctomycetota bacterium]
MDATLHLFAELESRRLRLGMSKVDLARRADVSLPTVRRLLSGHERRARTDIVAAIAAALGVEVRLSGSSYVHELSNVSAFRRKQAHAKAKRLVRLVQGTMALESEAVGDDVLDELEEQNVHALLAGPARRLWGE